MDAGLENGVPFLVQRYVDGVDLQELVDRSPELLSTAAVTRIVSDVARGLTAIHRAGVVHRDIKPENIFLEGLGDGVHGFGVKLLDFGIAKAITPTKSNPWITDQGVLLGLSPIHL